MDSNNTTDSTTKQYFPGIKTGLNVINSLIFIFTKFNYRSWKVKRFHMYHCINKVDNIKLKRYNYKRCTTERHEFLRILDQWRIYVFSVLEQIKLLSPPSFSEAFWRIFFWICNLKVKQICIYFELNLYLMFRQIFCSYCF